MFRFKRILYSLSFRVNITLFILLLLLGWAFTKATTFLLTRVGNASQCYNISMIVGQEVDSYLLRVENGLQASALTSQTKHLTMENSEVFCDSVQSIINVDSVYIDKYNDSQSCVQAALNEVWKTNKSMWTEPYRDKHGDILVTYLTPLQDKRGNTYAMLCANLTTKWIADLAKQKCTNDSTHITVRSPKNRFIYNYKPSRVLQVADSTEMGSREDKGVRVGEIHIGYFEKQSGYTYFDRHIDRVGWSILCEMPDDNVGGLAMVIMVLSYMLIFILFVVMAVVLMLVLRWYLHPLTKIANATDEISRGNFDVELPKVSMHTDIRQLRDSFVRMQHAIKQHIIDLRSATEQKVSIERDITIAAHIQSGMLPRVFDKRKDIDIHGFLQPAKTVGGDLYDYFVRRSYTDHDGDHEYLFFILGDVSGKGVPAALIMSVVCHLFRNVSRRSTDAARIAGSINASLSERNDENMFCTAFVGVLDLATGHLEYCNAGHNAPIVIKRVPSDSPKGERNSTLGQNGEEKVAEFLKSANVQLPLGVDSHFLYRSQSMQLDKDDILFLYTDGITEAENADKQLFGDDAALKAVLSASRSTSMEVLVANVLASVQDFVDGTEQSDDITMLALRRLVPDPEPLRTVTEELEREYEKDKKRSSRKH